MQNEIMKQIIDYILPILTIGLASFAASLAVQTVSQIFVKLIDGILYLKAKVNENKYMAMAKFDDWFFDKLTETAIAVRGEVVDRIKLASEDGKLTMKEIKHVKDQAYKIFLDSLTNMEKDEFFHILGEDAKRIFMARIPTVVEHLKEADWLRDVKSDEDDDLLEDVKETVENPQ